MESSIDLGKASDVKLNIAIGKLVEELPSVYVVGEIAEISDAREFERKDGSKGRVRRMTLQDGTDSIPVVLWDEWATLPLLQKGERIAISKGYTKTNDKDGKLELHTGRRSTITLHEEPKKEPQREAATPPSDGKLIKVVEPSKDVSYIDPISGKVYHPQHPTPPQEPRSEPDRAKEAVTPIDLEKTTADGKLVVYELSDPRALRNFMRLKEGAGLSFDITISGEGAMAMRKELFKEFAEFLRFIRAIRHAKATMGVADLVEEASMSELEDFPEQKISPKTRSGAMIRSLIWGAKTLKKKGYRMEALEFTEVGIRAELRKQGEGELTLEWTALDARAYRRRENSDMLTVVTGKNVDEVVRKITSRQVWWRKQEASFP